jgi:hypothetical protein
VGSPAATGESHRVLPAKEVCLKRRRIGTRSMSNEDLTSSKDGKPKGKIPGRPFELSAFEPEKVHSAITVVYWLRGLGGSGASMVFGGLNGGGPSPGSGLSNCALSLPSGI